MDTVHIFPTKALEKHKTQYCGKYIFPLSRSRSRRLKQKLKNYLVRKSTVVSVLNKLNTTS
jgi:hypothetical protein